MRQRFRARELWLFAPFVLIGALAFYWQRAASVSAPGAHWTTSSTLEVEAAPGYYQEQGKMHHVTVRLAHPWPRPRWWGQKYSMSMGLDPRDVETDKLRPTGRGGAKNEQGVSRNGVVFATENADGKEVVSPTQQILSSPPTFDGGQCTFDYYVDLNKIAASPQPLTLRGAFVFEGNEPLEVEHLIRKKGEHWNFVADKNQGARLLAVNASARFYQSSSHPVGKPVEYTDFTHIFFLLRPSSGNFAQGEQPKIEVYDLELRDARDKIYREYAPYGVFFSESGSVKYDANQIRNGEILYQMRMEIKNLTSTQGQLTVRGKISVGEHWPIPFEVSLPPRSSASPTWSEEETWERPAKF